jgi:protein involved in sex pheromone biosynthesis
MLRFFAATAAVLILSGCSPSPEKAAKDAKQAADSWNATLSEAADARGSGRISSSFFKSIVTQAITSLKKEAQTARKSGGDAAAAPVDAVTARAKQLQ